MAKHAELPCSHFSAGERKLKYPRPGFGYNQESSVRIETIYFSFSVLPRPKFLFFCANSGHWPDSCGKFRTSVSSIFLLERESRNIQTLILDTTRNRRFK